MTEFLSVIKINLSVIKKIKAMKKLILLCFLLSIMAGKSQNTGVVTSTLIVKGNCEECKKRIENAADIKGVKFFEWNSETKVAKVIYNPSKTEMKTIEKAIAARGYDTESEKADEKAYSKLPACCKYRTTKCEEK